jgi:hypothetical protein
MDGSRRGVLWGLCWSRFGSVVTSEAVLLCCAVLCQSMCHVTSMLVVNMLFNE